MPDVEVRPGLTTNYRISGPDDAPVLLLITGLGGLQEGWFRQVPHFERAWRVVTFDNRGAGRSSVLDEPARMIDFADDTRRLLDLLAIPKAHVWGVSMGGKVAQELALAWPERVDKLILGCTTAGDAHRVEGHAPSGLTGASGSTEQEWLDRIVPLLFGREYREKNANSMKAFARGRARHPQDPRGAARQWEAYHGFDSWDRLPEITHRTLVITGDEDALTHPGNADRLLERLPNAVKYVVPGAGHSFHLEKPDEVNQAVEQFLRTGSP